MKIHEYNEMMAYLTRPAPRQPVFQGGVIGEGGMFQGEDLGYRTGFSNTYKKKLLTFERAKRAGIDISSLSPEYQELFKKGELYYTRTKGGPKRGLASRTTVRNVIGNEDKIDIILGNKMPTDLLNLPEEISNKSKVAKQVRMQVIKQYLETLPEGKVINLDVTTKILNEEIKKATNGKITMVDK